MSRTRYQVPQDDGGFDLTPMIDVVFLLIVFFMTVASALTTQKKELNLAVAEEGEIPENIASRFSCSVSPDGKFYVMKQQVTLEELAQRMSDMRQKHPKLKVVLRADRLTEHQYINDILGVCAKNGVNNVIFATYQSAL